MLNIITVDSALESIRKAFLDELYLQIRSREQTLRYYQDQFAYLEVIGKEKNILIVQPEYHANSKASLLLFDFIGEVHRKINKPESLKNAWSVPSRDIQIWIVDKLNEGTVRKIRSMEDGNNLAQLSYHCLMLHKPTFQQGEKEEAYGEVKRVTKISQNGKNDTAWINWNPKRCSEIVSLLLGGAYVVFYGEFGLPRETNANIQQETPLSQIMRQYYSDLKGREIHWYPKKYVHKAMDEEKWGVDPLPKGKQGSVKRHVLVTGTGRSGTTYFHDLLTLLGLDVGHQRNGKDGCSGAEFAVDYDWYPWFPVYGGGDCANVGERRSDYTYSHVLHIVRHPLWCIPSLMKNYPAINPEFWADNGSMDPAVMDSTSIIRNATMYYAINSVIDKSGQAEYRCQLEQIHDHWSTLMEILEMKGTKDPELGATNKASGWGQYEPLTWAQLENEVGSVLSNSIRSMAKEYGYE